jgi:hypothetical protein
MNDQRTTKKSTFSQTRREKRDSKTKDEMGVGVDQDSERIGESNWRRQVRNKYEWMSVKSF